MEAARRDPPSPHRAQHQEPRDDRPGPGRAGRRPPRRRRPGRGGRGLRPRRRSGPGTARRPLRSGGSQGGPARAGAEPEGHDDRARGLPSHRPWSAAGVDGVGGGRPPRRFPGAVGSGSHPAPPTRGAPETRPRGVARSGPESLGFPGPLPPRGPVSARGLPGLGLAPPVVARRPLSLLQPQREGRVRGRPGRHHRGGAGARGAGAVGGHRAQSPLRGRDGGGGGRAEPSRGGGAGGGRTRRPRGPGPGLPPRRGVAPGGPGRRSHRPVSTDAGPEPERRGRTQQPRQPRVCARGVRVGSRPVPGRLRIRRIPETWWPRPSTTSPSPTWRSSTTRPSTRPSRARTGWPRAWWRATTGGSTTPATTRWSTSACRATTCGDKFAGVPEGVGVRNVSSGERPPACPSSRRRWRIGSPPPPGSSCSWRSSSACSAGARPSPFTAPSAEPPSADTATSGR